jgi:cytochrome c oxidase cbb3-type subunit IV
MQLVRTCGEARDMTHETVVLISQLLATLIFGGLFLGVLIYAFRPANRRRFENAAQLPINKAASDRPGEPENG